MADARQSRDDRSGSGKSDEELMLAFCRGSEESFAELFLRYRQPLFGFFRRRIEDGARAEELTQDTFLVVLRGAAKWEPTALFRTYLYAIGLKVLSAERRKTSFRAAFLVREGPEPAAHNSLDTNVLLRDAMQKLERTDREILMLREFEHLSYAEIGELLRLPVNTVRSRLFRARMALKKVLETPAQSVSAQRKEVEERV